jgi:hypothetical protein
VNLGFECVHAHFANRAQCSRDIVEGAAYGSGLDARVKVNVPTV